MEFKAKELNSVASLIRAMEEALEKGVDFGYSYLSILVKEVETMEHLSLMFEKDLNIEIKEEEYLITSWYTIDFKFKENFTLKVSYVEAKFKENK